MAPLFSFMRHRRYTQNLSRTHKAGNADLTGHGTLQQMWERVLPAKRRAGGARSQERHYKIAWHLVAIMLPPAGTLEENPICLS